ncbi:cytochrome P450 [Zychaea mexicana]|uniref:cytochrome P450 n=1 Tax=Zychaea mexicana TaxID=64656 RepID=UPI0022FF35E0|nr:cytochrome P450 [Zychaea mexicana]KAI9498282.1 cytochrome P450 [Zychaea mexicana]
MDLTTVPQKLSASATKVIKLFTKVKQEDLKKAGTVTLFTLATYLIALKLHDAFLGPLSGLPGPLGLKFYDMIYARGFADPPGGAWKKFKFWQEKYGDIVRLGPTTVSISDKHMIRQVLLKDDLPKGPRYEGLSKFSITLFSAVDKNFHKQRRRIVSPAFSVKYVNSLEHYMLAMIQAFIERIDSDIEATLTSEEDGYGQVDIWKLLAYLALDIIGETAFGQTFHMLETNDHMVPRTITTNLQLAASLAARPYTVMLKSMFSLGKLVESNKKLRDFMGKIIVERLQGGPDARRDDVLQILIDTQQANDAKDRMTAEAIAQETILFLVAGSDTTSNTTGFAVIELLKNPHVFTKLRAEIDNVQLRPDQKLLEHDQVKKLPYLNAVINENLRLNPIDVDCLERRADRDMVLDGRLFVPKNTIILSNVYCAHLDPKYWPEPTKFKPERWLEGSQIPADTEAFYPFSIGTRNCIGKGFAQQQIRLSLSNLVRFYDFKAIPAEMNQSDDRVSFITWTLKSNSFKILMKRRCRE